MKIFRISRPYNQEIIMHQDFIGFHCQKRQRSNYDDSIEYGNLFDGDFENAHYVKDSYEEILEALPIPAREEAMSLNLLGSKPEDIQELQVWAESCKYIFDKYNIRWIFVSETKPLDDQYGDYRYYVLMPDRIVLAIINDIFVNDIANAYVYDGRAGSPTLIELDSEEDGYEDVI